MTCPGVGNVSDDPADRRYDRSFVGRNVTARCGSNRLIERSSGSSSAVPPTTTDCWPISFHVVS